jgi:ABC-2 type transport system permease protein
MKTASLRQRKLFPVYVFAKINARRYFRDRTAIFFTIAFPLIFLFVFGGIFGRNTGVSFKVAILNSSHSQFAQAFVNNIEGNKAFKVNKSITTLSAANNQMAHGGLDASIILPPDFGTVHGHNRYPSGQAEVFYTENNVEAAQTLTSVLRAEFQDVNAKFVKAAAPFSVTSKQSNSKGLTQFDYTFSGLLGFSIIGMGIFGPINVFPELKKQGILRRFHTTPLRVWQYFVANMMSQALIGLVGMTVMFIFAIRCYFCPARFSRATSCRTGCKMSRPFCHLRPLLTAFV